jgi:hypothetical protein
MVACMLAADSLVAHSSLLRFTHTVRERT